MRVGIRTKILFPVTVFTLLIVSALSATAWKARADVGRQVEARVEGIAEVFGQFFATSVLAGEDANYSRLQHVIETIQKEDEKKRFFAFILVAGGDQIVGSVHRDLVSPTYHADIDGIERLRAEFRALAETAEIAERERADERMADARRLARAKLEELSAAQQALYVRILDRPDDTPGLRVYRALIHDCRPDACEETIEARRETQRATVLVGIAYAPFVRERWESLVWLAGISGFGLLLGSGGAFWLAGSVTRPVRALVDAMKDVDKGNYGRRVEISSADEIGVLAKSFNGMAAGLEERERLRAEGDRLRYRVKQSEKRSEQLQAISQELQAETVHLQEEKMAISEALEGLASYQVARRFLQERAQLDFTGATEEATVLFADIRGFTSMCERLGPDPIFEMLNDYFGRMRSVADRYEGCILKFMGDALMISYNVPEPQTHHALRAVYTGIDMQREILKMNKAREAAGKEPINVGIGINTGSLMVGNVGSKRRFDYTVIGDAVNTAQRIESITPAQHLHISESCWNQVSEYVEVVAREPVVLKGKEKPVQIYAVVRRTKKVIDFTPTQGAS